MLHSSLLQWLQIFNKKKTSPMHPAGLDMTHGSLRDILDGNEVNVSTALPPVPQDTTNPFINPNQTLADIIPGRNLGPLSSLKITDADLIIRNLNSELNAPSKKMTLAQRFSKNGSASKANRIGIGDVTSRKGSRHSGKMGSYYKPG